jgi:FeS assembly SUF system regulator
MTKTADYAIVLLTRMASHEDRIFNAPELAQQTQLPAPTVSKILKILARDGLLRSHRGAKGGYALERSPEDVSVVEIITAVDGPVGITECIDDTPGECGQESVCPVRGNWQRINDAIRRALDDITLAEMVPPQQEGLVTLGQGRAETSAELN